MERISLKQSLPLVFAENTEVKSDIWNSDICFEKGRTYLIKANSGTGKSSLCSFIYGYRVDFSGNIYFDNTDITSLKTSGWDEVRQKNLSLMFQELRLFPELTSIENIRLKNNQTNFKTEAEIDVLLERLGVAERKDYLIGKMSWGQQQRIAIIRALCQPFDFLMIDEPISHLDETNAMIVSQIIQEEIEKQNAGLIVTSIGKDLPVDYSQILSL